MDDSDKRKIGERLRTVLDEKGISQTTVASWFGITQSSVSSWCRGASEFSITTGLELSRRLGVSLDWLVGLSEERNEAPSSHDQAVLELAGMIRTLGVERVVQQARGAAPPFLIGVGENLISVPPPNPEDWDRGGTPNESMPPDDGSGSYPPTNESLANFVKVMKKVQEVEQRVEAAEKKLDRRGRARNTTGEKRRKAQ